MTDAASARSQLRKLQEEYHDHNPAFVPTLPFPSAVEFSKQVSKGLPCVFATPDALPDECTRRPQSSSVDGVGKDDSCECNFPWKALAWTKVDLTSSVTEKVEVAVTPTGCADALALLEENEHQAKKKVFLQPASIELTLSELLSHLVSTESLTPRSPVHYLQSQNSNLTTTALSSLMKDLPENFDFAQQILGEPDARNIWIGSERSVTSVHRDPYENLYLVLKGSKLFRLWAPVDEIAMPTSIVSTGSYVYDATKNHLFDIKLDDEADTIPWIDMDPLDPRDEQDMAERGARMRSVTVSEGEILYLPSGWYHHVSQTCGHWADGSVAPCIAINYWYDMDYEGEKYVMRQMVSRLVEESRDTAVCGQS